MDKFPCNGCGRCCETIGRLIRDHSHPLSIWYIIVSEFPYSYDSEDACKMYDKSSKKCMVYDNRPMLCRVDDMYKRLNIGVSIDHWYSINKKGCESLKNEFSNLHQTKRK